MCFQPEPADSAGHQQRNQDALLDRFAGQQLDVGKILRAVYTLDAGVVFQNALSLFQGIRWAVERHQCAECQSDSSLKSRNSMKKDCTSVLFMICYGQIQRYICIV